ncbi:MAG: RluA family pseudouridine synthase [Christensenellales bacterium]|jgi:23S rRNA pseudouridine955/2504/2580 synthase
MTKHIVEDSVRGLSLARYLSRAWPMVPQRLFREALKKRDVRINGAKSGGDAPVFAGDELTLYLDEKYLAPQAKILADEGDFFVAEKPAGLPVDADADGIGADTLLTRAKRYCPSAALCHRLDAGTGGLCVLAKTEEARERIEGAFRTREVRKEYVAIAVGIFQERRAQLTHYLLKDEKTGTVRAYDAPIRGAKTAELEYEVLSEEAGLSRVRILLHTGRTHQIRVQLARVGHPLLGDDKYGNRLINREHRAESPRLWCAKIELFGKAYTSEPQF